MDFSSPRSTIVDNLYVPSQCKSFLSSQSKLAARVFEPKIINDRLLFQKEVTIDGRKFDVAFWFRGDKCEFICQGLDGRKRTTNIEVPTFRVLKYVSAKTAEIISSGE